MLEVLVNRSGGLSLPRKSVVRLTDRPDMTLDVYSGRKTTIQQQQYNTKHTSLRLLEIATFNNLVMTSTLGPNKPYRRWTWHSQDGKHHNQIDNILVEKRFRSGVNIHRTRSFQCADLGSDHDLVMMTFRVRLKKARKPNQPRLIKVLS